MFVGFVLSLLPGVHLVPLPGSFWVLKQQAVGVEGGIRHGGCPISIPHSRPSLTAALLLWPRLPHGCVLSQGRGSSDLCWHPEAAWAPACGGAGPSSGGTS